MTLLSENGSPRKSGKRRNATSINVPGNNITNTDTTTTHNAATTVSQRSVGRAICRALNVTTTASTTTNVHHHDLERELGLYERLQSTVLNQFLLNPFEVTELEGAIGSLPCKKNPGHVCILNKHILHGGAALNDLLLLLFNSVLKSACVPDG